jgi:hypothetical protein
MKTRISTLIEALRTMNPSGSNPYWRSLPIRRMKRLLLGTFLLASVIGFATNLTLLDRRPLLHGFFFPLAIACVATCILVIRLTKPRWVLLVILLATALLWSAAQAQSRAPALPQPRNMRADLVFNAFGIWIGAALGTRLIMSFLTTEGVARVRMQTELLVAHNIQATLVPPISLKTPRFELYGISLPSAEMGGDLVDAISTNGHLVAYVADVSGHGLPAGQLMGMLKTVMRFGIELRQQPVALMENANRVLPSLKEPEMYATMALLHFDESPQAEYAVVAHPPILHYRKASNDIARLAMRQFPVGLFPTPQYTSARIPYSPGDLFLILTDGIIEVLSEQDEEFGLKRVETLVVRHAAEQLPNIWEAIRSAATAHGPQDDDQSALFVRAL